MGVAVLAAATLRHRTCLPGRLPALCSLGRLCSAITLEEQGMPWSIPAGLHSMPCSHWAVANPVHHCHPWSWQQHPQHHHHHQHEQLMLPLSLQNYSTDTRPADVGTNSSSSKKDQQQSQQQPQPHRQHVPPQRTPRASAARAAAAFQAAGWSRHEVVNVPNVLSLLRLLSGPLIASWIVDHQWSLAVPALALSGASDWADGFAARRLSQPSVIGSYLDPLADKVLICSVVGALGWEGTLPLPVVAIVVGRDVVLVVGAFVARAKALGWRWPGWAEFFRVETAGVAAAAEPGSSNSGNANNARQARWAAAAGGQQAASAQVEGGDRLAEGSSAGGSHRVPAAPLVQPLFISKVNTVFQLGLVGTCMLTSWLGWPGEAAVWVGSGLTAGTTIWSSWAYLQAYRQGRVLAPTAPH